MKRITSSKNETLKFVKRLGSSAKARHESNETLFEGIHVCEAYISSGQQPRLCIVSDSALLNDEVQAIISQLSEASEPLVVPDSLFSTLSTVENGVGVLFVVGVPQPEGLVNESLTEDALLLDGVQDPGNMGGLLRTAAAAGIKHVFISEGSAGAWSPRAIRAGMGAHMSLQIFEGFDLAALINNSSVPVFATSLSANQSLYEAGLVGKSAWLFGAEGQGVSEELLQLCGGNTVVIPQTADVESLNVAAAAAICLFEQRRQRLSVV